MVRIDCFARLPLRLESVSGELTQRLLRVVQCVAHEGGEGGALGLGDGGIAVQQRFDPVEAVVEGRAAVGGNSHLSYPV